MKKISRKFNWLLIMSISLSVILASFFSTGLLIFRSERENHKHNLMQLNSLTDNIEGFFIHAYTLNHQLSLNPIIIENIKNAEQDWETRQQEYRGNYLSENINSGFPFLVEMAEQYPWAELFFVQDNEGRQTARSSDLLGERGSRWWFRKMIDDNEHKSFISESYYSMTGNIPVASVFHPVYDQNHFIGIMGTDINFSRLQQMIGGYLYSETMSAVLIDSTGTIVAHPDPKQVNGLYNLINMQKQIMRLGTDDKALLDESGHHLTQSVPADISPYLQKAAQLVLQGDSGYIKQVILDKSLCSLYYKPVTFPGAERGDYYGVILINNHNQLIHFVTLLMIGLIVMIVSGSWLLYQLFHRLFEARILTPLGILVDAMHESQILDFKSVEVNTGDEFDLLASTYNNLRKDLAKTHLNLQEKMNELALSEEGYRAFASISLAMSAEKEKRNVLKQIVRKGMDLCQAEGGTLYLYNKENQILEFEILKNDVLDINKLKDELGYDFFPPVPVEIKGKQNRKNVSSYCALTGELINIKDVYNVQGFDFEGMKRYDSKNNYRSRSMLVIPMKNLEGEIVGVLQLINTRNPQSQEIDFFSEHHENIARILASQGAVTLTNIQLHNSREEFLYSFIRSIATAIDEKSSYTGGHIERVAKLTSMIAEAVNKSENERFKNFMFNNEELEELRMAAWMHDVGKISIPEAILDKSTKLMHFQDGFSLIETRARLIAATWKNDFLQQNRIKENPKEKERLEIRQKEMQNFLQIIKQSNIAHANLTDDEVDSITRSAKISATINGETITLLTPEELHFLSIKKGTLDAQERKIIESHVNVSRKILEKLPFPDHLSQLPLFVYQHHERLDGSGYDTGIGEKQLPIQSRIIALSDVFEALTASDRPYRKPLSKDEALEILKKMSDENLIDHDLYDLLLESGIIDDYYEKVK